MFTGSLVAMVTPFDQDGRIDDAALERLIAFHVGEGTDGLVIAGTTGESATLEKAEHAALIARAVELVAGRLPVIAGTGSNATTQTIDLSRKVGGMGIDAYLMVVPYYNKPSQEGMYRHFAAVADAVEKPIMLYNVPGRTGADLLPETVARLAAHENIFGLKEATGDIERLKQIRALVPADFMLYSGDDPTALAFMEQGGHGVVTVTGNVVPNAMSRLCALALAGQHDDAGELDQTLQPLNAALFLESNPIPVKWALEQMGLIDSYLRLPLTSLARQYHAAVRAALEGAGVKLRESR